MSRKFAFIGILLAIAIALIAFKNKRAISDEHLESMLDCAIQSAWPIDTLNETPHCREVVISVDKTHGAVICLAIVVGKHAGEKVVEQLSQQMKTKELYGDDETVDKATLPSKKDANYYDIKELAVELVQNRINNYGRKKWRTDLARYFVATSSGNDCLCWRYSSEEEIYYIYLLNKGVPTESVPFQKLIADCKNSGLLDHEYYRQLNEGEWNFIPSQAGPRYLLRSRNCPDTTANL